MTDAEGSARSGGAILCPRCGALESPRNAACHRCGGSLAPVARKVVEAATWLSRPDLPVLILRSLLFLHYIAVGWLTIARGGRPIELLWPGPEFAQALLALGAIQGHAVLVGGEWWRLATAMFAHFGILHLFFNTMALNAVGAETTRNLGPARFVLVYLLSGILANAASLWWNGLDFFQVGASGAICGLIGSLTMIARIRGGAYQQVVQRVTTQWIVMVLVFGFLVSGVDNVAHVVGMIAGALLTRMVGLRRSWMAP